MPDEMRTVAQKFGEQRRLGLEVASRQRWACPEARAVGKRQRPALGERMLLTPRLRRAHHAAVDEYDRGTRADTADLHIAGERLLAHAHRQWRTRTSPRPITSTS